MNPTRFLLMCSLFASCCLWPVAGLAQDDGGPEADEAEEGEELPITKLPKIKAFVKATYPAKALEENLTTDVLLEIDISAEGEVEAVRVVEAVEPEGYGFEEAAVEAVFQFEFEPAETSAGPIPVTITYKYRFVIEEKKVEKAVKDIKKDDEVVVGEDPVAESVVNVTGVALERGTRIPLVGEIVTIFQDGDEEGSVGYEANTDEKGRFEFYDIPPGDWKLLIRPEGYFPFRALETVVEGEVLDITCYVERGRYNEFDVLVEGTRSRKEVTRRVLQAEVIERIPGTFGDPIKVVENLPGVARTGFGNGGAPVVRGGAPEDTKVYIEGVEVPLLFHFGGLRSVIPVGILKQITFVPGNFSTYYGRAHGGVLDVQLKALRPEGISGYADINLFDSGAYIEAPLGDKAALAIAARRSYIDFVLNAVIPDSAPVNLIAAPRYYDAQLLFSWRPVKEHELRLFTFLSDDTLELLFENAAGVDPSLRSGSLSASTGFVRGLLTHIWTPTEDFKNELTISTGEDRVDFNLGNSQVFFDASFYTATLRDTMRWDVNERINLTMGLDAVWSNADLTLRVPIEGPPKEGETNIGPPDLDEVLFFTTKDTRNRPTAAFMELELQGFDDLLLIPGGRIDYFEQTRSFTFDPRLIARYDLNDEWTIKGGVGVFHQAPTPDETAEGIGNPELSNERAIHYSLGFEWRPLEHLSLDVIGFYKDIQDLIAANEQTIDDPDAAAFGNNGEGRVVGLEVLAKHELANNFFGWISYTLSRAERLDPGETQYRLFDFDQTHILTLIGSYQFPRNWEVAMRWRYVTGNPNTPILGGIYNADRDIYEPVIGPTNSDRLEPFHQLDLRVDKRWIYDTWRFALYMDIQNVYNRSNIEGTDFNFDYSETRPQQGLPLLPVLGFKGEF